jgi:hypothetical protein
MVFNATFNNISATLYILAVSFLVEEAGENYRPYLRQNWVQWRNWSLKINPHSYITSANYINPYTFFVFEIWKLYPFIYLAPLSTIFQLHCISWRSVFWWRKPEKTTDLSRHWHTLSHNIVSNTPHLNEILQWRNWSLKNNPHPYIPSANYINPSTFFVFEIRKLYPFIYYSVLYYKGPSWSWSNLVGLATTHTARFCNSHHQLR